MLTRPRMREVHVWRSDLDRIEARPELLSPEETARAGRFRFEQDRRRWMAARAWLRLTLGRYLDAAPDTLRFELGPWGKPGLRNCPLRFNVTHSGGAALLAVAWQQEVGIDLEQGNRDFCVEEAASALSAPEQVWLSGHAPEQRGLAFLTLWTAKEAYVKATGQGLTFPTTGLTLLPAAGTDRMGSCRLISVCRLEAGPNCRAALALEGPLDTICYFTDPCFTDPYDADT